MTNIQRQNIFSISADTTFSVLRAALLCLSPVATAASGADVIDYPTTGVELGQGWNSYAVEKTTATCIVFQKGRTTAQTKNMTMRAVTSKYQLDRELGLSASASYKNTVASVSGKATFAGSSKVETSGTTVAALARVDNGNIFVSPPDDARSDMVAALISEGNSPDEVNGKVGVSDAEIGQQIAQVLPDLASADIDARHRAFDIDALNDAAADGRTAGAIRLGPEFAEMARTNLQKFHQVCGDSYVASISEGGDLAMVFNFQTSSLEKQRKITAELKGSGWGATAEGSMESKIKSVSEGTQTSITYNQTGGSGDPVPTDVAALYEKIKTFPKVIEDAPFRYTLQVASYEDLINWPDGATNPQASVAAIDQLIYRASVWQQLDQDLTVILEATSAPFGLDAYLLGRGVKRSVLADKQDVVRARHAAVSEAIRQCIKKGNDAPPCELQSPLLGLSGSLDAVTAEEMEIRALMPLPIASAPNPAARLMGSEALRDQLFEVWIQRVNAARCAYSNAAVCLSDNQIRPFREKIPVDGNAQFVLLANALNRACMKSGTTDRVNLVEGCGLDDPSNIFTWDANKRHLIHVRTNKCVNVRAGSLKEGADIILFPCQGTGAKFANDRWSITRTNSGWFQFRNEMSRKCITVLNDLRSARRLSQSDCSKGRGQALKWRMVMQ